MYSRYGENPPKNIRLPEHYGGSAFSQKPNEAIVIPKKETPHIPTRESFGEKASPTAERFLRTDIPTEKPIERDAVSLPEAPQAESLASVETEEKQKTPTAHPLHFDALRSLLGGKEGKLGEDSDRLLLLGLILLLSRTEGESDILLWLSLLLLCG